MYSMYIIQLSQINRYNNSNNEKQLIGQELKSITSLWKTCNLTSFSPCLTGPVDYLFASCHKGARFKSPGGYLCETGILLLALSCYIGDPNVIDHFCGLVWGRLRPEPSLGPCADNVIIPLDITQLFCIVKLYRNVP